MAYINNYYLDLPGSYFFTEIARKVVAYKTTHPEKEIIRLSIGDVTRPLVPAVVEALHIAADEMGQSTSFCGYGPEQGYPFLIDAIIAGDYTSRGVHITPDEVFISDGAKCDIANIQELFDPQNTVAIADPVYPVYVDSNVMSGRLGNYENGIWTKLIYLPCTVENNFIPQLPSKKPDLIYLCYPNNPTGTVLSKEQLALWVHYAKKEGAIILFDAAYEAYITDPDIPHSIFEIDGAREVAIEFRSFSKTAGFTGLRCAYTIVPKELKACTRDGREQSLNAMWSRRQTTKYNGCSYVVQKAATAIYSTEGRQQTQLNVQYYMNNASTIQKALERIGITAVGGVNAPYVWLKTPDQMSSWDFFDLLLEKTAIVGTPGVGFGPHGEGYFRLTGFGSYEDTHTAIQRIQQLF